VTSLPSPADKRALRVTEREWLKVAEVAHELDVSAVEGGYDPDEASSA
jgi:hypothetical protein